MKNWLPHPTVLQGQTVDLLPLDETHFDTLIALANDKRIWEFYSFDGCDAQAMKKQLDIALQQRQAGTQYPFVVWYKPAQKIVGSTRFLDIQPVHQKLEIGFTWLHPDYWATVCNVECKLLLLTYCFEQLKATRVQLKTDENNQRSRKAIQKIGGIYEGILRHDMVRDNGTLRNSAYYSILPDEWNSNVKQHLLHLFESKKKQV